MSIFNGFLGNDLLGSLLECGNLRNQYNQMQKNQHQIKKEEINDYIDVSFEVIEVKQLSKED